MTVMETEQVSKQAHTLGDLRGVHPSIQHLPISVLEGDGDSEGNLDMAGKAAAEVYTNWPDDEWRNSFIMGLAQHIENQLVYHRAELQDLHDKAKSTVLKNGRRAIVKAYISDVMNEMVSKAGVFDPNKHPRGARGRFSDSGQGESLGYDESYGNSDYDRQQSASLAASMLMASQKTVTDGQPAEFTIRNSKNGKVRTVTHTGKAPKLERHERIVQIRNMGPDNPLYARANDTVNMATLLGANKAQAGAAGATVQEMSRQGQIKYNQDGSTNWFGRLESASETLHHSTNDDRVRAAAAMGKYVGQYGPEASKTVGPHMRRMSYKYRGEAAPAAQWLSVARAGRQTDSKGKLEDKESFENKLALNLQMPKRTDGEKNTGGLGAIPTEHQEDLLLRTGSTAPSHGFILNSRGEVKQQAKGKSDDHYVPFNIKDFHHLNHGSYVRSRAFGGPTTDDFATALKTGATSFTTISRTGMYRVEFTPQTDKSGKKTGAWAKDTAGDGNHAMVTRYGKLLDAVNHGKVVDPETNAPTVLNGHGYDLALQSLQKQFPYQIKKVTYTRAADTGSSSERGRASYLQRDTGYVRPYYLKPGAADYGYHDPLLGPKGSFDDLDAYRLGKARFWATQQKTADARAAQQRQRDIEARAAGNRPPLRTQDQAPVKGAYPWLAGTGEYGERQYSTPATQLKADPRDTWSKTQTKAYLEHLRAAVDHAGPGREMPDAHQLYEKLQLQDSNSTQGDWEDFVDAVSRNTGGIRDDINDVLNNDLLPMMRDDQTGLALGRKANRQAEENDASMPDYSGPASHPDDIEADSDIKRYRAFQELFGRNGRLNQLKNATAPAKVAERDALENAHHDWMTRDALGSSPFDRATTPSPDYDGLSFVQYQENRLDRAGGRSPRHKVSDDYIPQPEKSSTAVTSDMDDEEAERQAQRYLEQETKDLDRGDIDGHGRDRDWS